MKKQQQEQSVGRRLLPMFVASVAMVAGLTACGGGSKDNAAPATTPAPAPVPAPAPGPSPSPVPVPAVSSVSPQRFVPPARITVAGTNLDRVTQARLNSVALSIASQSPTTLALDVPANAASGFLTLVSDGQARQTAFQVTVDAPIGISSVTPATVVRGNPLAIAGSNLDRATAVEFAGGATAQIASRNGSTSITVTVPDAAQSGAPVVIGNAGDRVAAGTAVTVVARVVVDANATYSVPAAGATVTIAGSGLAQVTAVTIGTTAATISGRSDTQLAFVVPGGVACGPIVLQAPAQPSVAGGSLVVGGGCSLRAAGIEFAQVLAQSAGSTYQRIVPRKETLVRAYVVSAAAGNAAPTVRLTAFNDGTQLGTLAMTGPATLPQVAVGANPPDSVRYNETQTFNATLPADWVRSGLSIRVEIDPEQRFGATIASDATPVVGGGTGIDLVLVPLVSGSNVPTMPAVADVVDELVRRFPLARDRISVAIRAPYTLSSPTDGVDTEWSSVLSQLETLRRQEAPNRHYYGMVRPMVSAGTAGIGYVNRVGSSSPNLSSLGWDASRSWRRTMSHELGHNFSRPHAPCGGVAGPDEDYPYANGALGTAPLFESLLDDIQSPAGLTDIMGYCSGAWFSDYNYREVQRFMEAQPQPQSLVVGAQRAAATFDLLHVSGVITPQGVSFAPVRRQRGQAVAAAHGEYVLRLRTAAGPVIEVMFDATDVDHADGSERHFFVQLPDPGDLAGISVLRDGVQLPQVARRTAGVTTQGRGQATPPAPAYVQWSESGGELDVSWDAAAWPWLAVTHVAGDTRTVLAIDRTGGNARLATSALPAGGSFEFSLSDGLRSRLVEVTRQ